MITRSELRQAEKATLYALQVRQNVAPWIHGSQESVFRGADEECAVELMGLYRVMEQVVRLDQPLFKWRPCRVRFHLTSIPQFTTGRIVPTALGTRLLKYKHVYVDGYRTQFPKHEFHPLIELFGKYAQALDWYPEYGSEEACARLNASVADMRMHARSATFQNRRDRHSRNSREATKGLQDMITQLFHRRSRVLVVRLDLSYHADMTTFSGALANRDEWLVNERQARLHRVAFIRYVKRKYRAPALTYAWKEELGRYTSYHFHMLLFFDGSVVRDDFTVGNELGDVWSSDITGGRGRYHNCYASSQWHAGVGLIGYRDTARIKALKNEVVPYLTKSDYFIRLVARGRTFGKGALPKSTGKPRGRPRSVPFEL